MWKPEHRGAADRCGVRCPSGPTNSESLLIEPTDPPPEARRTITQRKPRAVIIAILTVLSIGRQ